MPRPKARPDPNEGRRSRLSLAKLASYDDVATDAMVDNVRVFASITCQTVSFLWG